MEYVYTAMLLHSAKKPVNEKSVTAVLEAAGVKPDSARVKALVASLKEVDIEDAIKSAAIAPVAAASAPSGAAPAGEGKKEEKPEEDEKKSEEEAAAGLGSLFG